MGQCASGVVKPPTIKATINGAELTQIIQASAPDAWITLFDEDYSIIDFKEFQDFAKLANLNPSKYRIDSHDCDDYAFIFLGKVREWYARNGSGGGLAMGVLTGDLKLKADDPYRGHAVVAHVSEDKKLKFYDPMWSSYEEIKPWMSIHNVIM